MAALNEREQSSPGPVFDSPGTDMEGAYWKLKREWTSIRFQATQVWEDFACFEPESSGIAGFPARPRVGCRRSEEFPPVLLLEFRLLSRSAIGF
jgi:hypothetical protein